MTFQNYPLISYFESWISMWFDHCQSSTNFWTYQVGHSIGYLSNFGFMILHSTNNNLLMRKWSNFVEIKFHSNENIKWHCIQLELNWIQIQNFILNSIQWNFNLHPDSLQWIIYPFDSESIFEFINFVRREKT